jgi:hypothetical protein
MPEHRFVTQANLPEELSVKYRSLLSLPVDRLRALNEWAKSNLGTVLQAEASIDLRAVSTELRVSRGDLINAISFLGTMLLDEADAGTDTSEDIVSFQAERLDDVGLGDLKERAKVLLAGVTLSADQAEYIRQKGLALQSVVPTLEGANVVCDLRSVFRRFPSPSPSARHEEGVRAFLGFEPVALVALEVNDASGNDTTCTFQTTEASLKSLVKTLQEALGQLATIKERAQALRKRNGV